MSFSELRIEDFSKGLITSPSATDLEAGSATSAVNTSFVDQGKLKKSRGIKAYVSTVAAFPSFPSGLVIDSFFEAQLSVPSSQKIFIISGVKSSRRRFYVTPWYNGSTWVTTAWVELTEAESTTVDASPSPSTTVYGLTGLANDGTTNYYSHFYIWNNTRSRYDYILSNTSGGVFTCKHGIPSTAAGDAVVVMRFPVFKEAATVSTFYQVDSLPFFKQHGENVYIHTGSHALTSGTDLTLNYSSTKFFNDSNLEYKGLNLDHAHPYRLSDNILITSLVSRAFYPAEVNETADPLPYTTGVTNNWIFVATAIFDGFQESNIFFTPDVSFSTSTGNRNVATVSDVTAKIRVKFGIAHFSFYRRENEWNLIDAAGSLTGTSFNSIFSRRIKKIGIYAAISTNTQVTPESPFFLVKTLNIDSTNWAVPPTWLPGTSYSVNDVVSPSVKNGRAFRVFVAGTSGGSEPSWNTGLGSATTDNTITWATDHHDDYYVYNGNTGFDVKGTDWAEAQKREFTSNVGHLSERTGAVAEMASDVAGQYVLGPIYADGEYKDALLVAPTSGLTVGLNLMPNVTPLSHWIRFRDQGIYDIVAHTEQNGRLVVFGANSMAIMVSDGINTRIVEQYQKRGLVSNRGVQVIDGVVYFCGVESIYAFDGSQVVDIGDRIKSDWTNISLANRQACFTGFNKRLKEFWIFTAAGIYVYSTLQNNWRTETFSVTFTYLDTGIDGEFLGTEGTTIYQIDAASYTGARALSWKSHHIDSSRIRPRRFRMSYKSSDTITAKLYDVEVSSSIPKDTIFMLPSSTEKHVDTPVSFESQRVMIELSSTSSTNDDTEIDYVAIAGHQKEQR